MRLLLGHDKKVLGAIIFCLATICIYSASYQENYIRYRVPSITQYNLSTLDNLEDSVDSWRCINQTACVYSAYWDERFAAPLVRLVAVIYRKADLSSWKCLLKYNNATFVEVPLKVISIPEDHNKNHLAAYMLCNAEKRPDQVEIVADLLKTRSITVQIAKPKINATGNLAICVRPIFGNFANNNSIIAEFIAYYQELGADHFTFYDYKSDFSVKHLFYEFMEDGLPIDFLPWNLPEPFSDAWSYGQLAFSADCLYRNSHSYEFVATLDIDEFIVPKQDISLKTLIEIVSNNNSKWGTYMFRQTFFCMEYEVDPGSLNLTVPLVTQIKTRHERKMWPYADRSKCIVRPVAVDVPGIHYTWEHIKPWKTLYVNANKAILHHYRSNKCKIQESDVGVLEKSALRYRKRILDSPVIRIWRMVVAHITNMNSTILSGNNL